MLIIKDIYNLQSYLTAYQNRKYSIGFVPTMGALHKGHGELIKKSKNAQTLKSKRRLKIHRNATPYAKRLIPLQNFARISLSKRKFSW